MHASRISEIFGSNFASCMCLAFKAFIKKFLLTHALIAG